MPTVDIPAFRYEITMLQQLRSVFLQEPLDRSCARFVWTNVDIADAFLHTGSIVSASRRGFGSLSLSYSVLRAGATLPHTTGTGIPPAL